MLPFTPVYFLNIDTILDGDQTSVLVQGESVFRLRNFNIVGSLLFILLRYMFRS
jgi:hypothetical protein